MQITGVSTGSAIRRSSTLGVNPKNSFAQVRQNQAPKFDLQVPQALQSLEHKLQVGGSFSSTELLNAQILIHKYNLKVELVSKAAEAVTSAAKRFQQQN